MTERLHFHVSLSCIGEGNGNPLQCSCLENPRDGGAWWVAVYGVAQGWTRLKRLSSSSIAGRNTSRVPLGLGVTHGERGEVYHVIVYMDHGERKGGSDKGLANTFSTRPAKK